MTNGPMLITCLLSAASLATRHPWRRRRTRQHGTLLRDGGHACAQTVNLCVCVCAPTVKTLVRQQESLLCADSGHRVCAKEEHSCAPTVNMLVGQCLCAETGYDDAPKATEDTLVRSLVRRRWVRICACKEHFFAPTGDTLARQNWILLHGTLLCADGEHAYAPEEMARLRSETHEGAHLETSDLFFPPLE